MAATNIGTDGTHKYPLAKMPAMSDAADIQIALRNYHYGQDAPLASGATPTGGISKYLYDIDTQLDEKENNGDIVEFKDDNFNFKINIVKTYLEDPLMRGSNVFDSEQYSRLFDIGEIKLDNNSKIPKPTHFIGNPYN